MGGKVKNDLWKKTDEQENARSLRLTHCLKASGSAKGRLQETKWHPIAKLNFP